MNEMEVYLVSEIGERYLGTVQGITHNIPDQLVDDFSIGTMANSFLEDLVSEIASREAGDFTSALLLQFRHPTGDRNVI